VVVMFSKTRHHSTGNLHLLGEGLLILQHLIHDFSAEIQLRRHKLLSSINIRNTRKQQINTLSHTRPAIILTLTKSIHRIQDKLGLHRGLRRSCDESDGENWWKWKQNAPKSGAHTRSRLEPKRRVEQGWSTAPGC